MRLKLALICIIIALVGIVSEVLNYGYEQNEILLYIKYFFAPIQLESPIYKRLFEERNVNYLNIFFYVLLLTGGILQAISKNEYRLIRYLFSIIGFSKALLLLIVLISLPFTLKYYNEVRQVLLLILDLVLQAGWIFLSFWILRYFRRQIPLRYIKREYLGAETNVLAEASVSRRFFNLVADIITFLLICMPIASMLVRIEFIYNMARNVSDGKARLVLYAATAITQFIFYFVFEQLFQATPGKMLSSTRVVTEDGGKSSFSKILVRSLSRLVPFEAFSGFGGRPWHDEWSETYVVKESHEGVNGKKYFLLIPLYLVTAAVIWGGYEQYTQYVFHKKQEKQFTIQRDYIVKCLDNLAVNDAIVLKEPGHWSEDMNFLLTEKIDASGYTFALISKKKDYSTHDGQLDFQQQYLDNKEVYHRFTFTKQQLLAAVRKEYDPEANDYFSRVKEGVDLLKYGKLYFIESIDPWFAPNIKLQNAYISRSSKESKTLSIELENLGEPASLIKIEEHSKNGLQWEDALPKTFRPSIENTEMKLSGTAPEIKDIDVILTFTDSLNTKRVYHVWGEEDKLNYTEMQQVE